MPLTLKSKLPFALTVLILAEWTPLFFPPITESRRTRQRTSAVGYKANELKATLREVASRLR